MIKRVITKIILYGLGQWIFLLLSIFAASLIFSAEAGAEMALPSSWGLVMVAVVMAGVSYALGRRLKPVTRRQALTVGLVWSGMTTLFMAITAFGNGTQVTVFGSWGMYVLLVAQVGGTLFVNAPKVNIDSSSPTN